MEKITIKTDDDKSVEASAPIKDIQFEKILFNGVKSYVSYDKAHYILVEESGSTS